MLSFCKLLSCRSFCTVVLYLLAMLVKVSPFATTWVLEVEGAGVG
jgi:hypothetical protein